MGRSDQDVAEQLDRYWDTVVRGAPAERTAVDPDLGATMRALHALDTPPAADPAFADRLWQQLLAMPASPSPDHRALRAPTWRAVRLWRGRERWLLAVAAACIALMVSAGAAFALGPWTRPIRVAVVPAGLVLTGPPPAHTTPVPPGTARPVYVQAATPDPGTAMSLADAERAANFRVLHSIDDPRAQLLGVAYSPPLTELDGHPIANPSAKVRLTYRLGDVTVTAEERRSPTAGQPLQVLFLGPGPPVSHVETHDGQEYLVTRVQANRVGDVEFATDSTMVSLVFSPPFVDWATAHDFIAHLG